MVRAFGIDMSFWKVICSGIGQQCWECVARAECQFHIHPLYNLMHSTEGMNDQSN